MAFRNSRQTGTPRLFRIPVDRIIVDDTKLIPTFFDTKCIAKDLKVYIRLTRRMPGVPTINFDGMNAVTINGAPLILAARDCVPPLENIICACVDIVPALIPADVERVHASDLIKNSESEPVFELLAFDHGMNAQQQQKAEELLKEFIEVTIQSSVGPRSHVIRFDWDPDGTYLLVTWWHPGWCAEQDYEVMKCIDSVGKFAGGLRSVNGYRWEPIIKPAATFSQLR